MTSSDLNDGAGNQADSQVLNPGLIARQPIVDAQRAVVAYELFDRSTARNAINAGSDVSLAFNAINHIGNELSVGSVVIFINCTHQSLSCAHLDLVQPQKVVLEVGPVPGHVAQDIEALVPVLDALRKRGFRLAFNHTLLAVAYTSWRVLADYVKLDLSVLKPEQLGAFVATIKSRTTALAIAEKIESSEQFTTMQGLGVTLFQGYWLAYPDVVTVKVATPAKASVVQLFNLVSIQAELEDIDAVLKKDALLGFNLLKLINSASMGLPQEVTSFRHAVMLLGMGKLTRWAGLLLVASRADGMPPVVGTMAVVRGRMMELLGAGTLSPAECESAFLVGILSLLDKLLGTTMEQAMALLTLPPAVSEALLHGTGKFGPMLALVLASENHDDESFRTAAIALNYSNHHINVAQMEAMIWADSVEV